MKYLLIIIGALLFFSSCSTLNKANMAMDKLKEKNPYAYYDLLAARSPKDTIFRSDTIGIDSLIKSILGANDSLIAIINKDNQNEAMEDYDSVLAKKVFDSLNAIAFSDRFFKFTYDAAENKKTITLLDRQKKHLVQQLQKSNNIINLLQNKLKEPIVIDRTNERKLEAKVVLLEKQISKSNNKVITLKGILYGLSAMLILFLILFFFLIKSKTKLNV